MAAFSHSEKTDMVLVLGICAGNRRQAQVEYARRYPTRRQPCAKTFTKIVSCLRRHGSFVTPYNAIGRRRNQTARDEMILAAVHVDPHQSTRGIAQQLDIGHSTVWRSLRRQKFHPYHLNLHQALHAEDPLRRIEFCMFLRDQLEREPDFLKYLLMSDEATFHRDGRVNLHNSHYWSETNPHWLRDAAHQIRWKTNVWCGIIGDRVVGPFFLDSLTGATYLEFLQGDFTACLDDLPLGTIARMWFQQDGASPHFAILVRTFLNGLFPGRWIGRAGPVSWPPRSPDLSSLDFFLWGYVKSLVYETCSRDVEDLQQKIRHAIATITPAILERVRSSTRQRVEDCLTADGGHFEHLY